MDHVAIDLGGRESQICSRSSTEEITLEKKMSTEKLKAFFGSIEPSRIILETCAEAFTVAAQAKEAGHDVRVVPATLVRSLGVGQRGIKTDQRDARCLSSVSVRVELGSVHIPSPLSREMKTSCGMREATVTARTSLVNNVRGWMRGELIRIRGGATSSFPERVRTHCSTHEIALPACVARQLAAIDSLTEEIRGADRELAELAKTNPHCQRLMTIPGVGPVSSIRFLAAVDEVKRFSDAHKLASYFGLTPGERSSSDTKHRTSLTKAGSKKVRWVLVQAAWCAYQSAAHDPMVLWAKQIAKRRGAKVAITALARKLAGIMFAILRDGSSYNASRGSTIRSEDADAPVIVAVGSDAVSIARNAPSEESDDLTSTEMGDTAAAKDSKRVRRKPAKTPKRRLARTATKKRSTAAKGHTRTRASDPARAIVSPPLDPTRLPEQTGPRSASLRDPGEKKRTPKGASSDRARKKRSASSRKKR